MATLDELKGTVDHRGDVMDVLASNYTRLTALVEGHGEQLGELRQQTTELRQQTAEIRDQTAEIKRDGQKTRRLWVAVAQKLDWLDLDEDFD